MSEQLSWGVVVVVVGTVVVVVPGVIDSVVGATHSKQFLPW